jgi:hypothetical protein
MKKPFSIVIAEDHTILRKGLKLLLSSQSDLKLGGEAEDGYRAFFGFGLGIVASTSASVRSPVDQAFLSSQGGQRGDIVEIELLHQVGAVFFNGLDTDTKEVCDLLIRVSFGNQL